MLRQSKGFSLPEGYKIIYKLPKKANYFFTVGKKFFTSAGCSKKSLSGCENSPADGQGVVAGDQSGEKDVDAEKEAVSAIFCHAGIF